MILRQISKALVVALVLIALLGFTGVSTARVLDTAEIKVRIHVPVIQQLEVIEPVAVSFTYPWTGAEDGQPLIIQNVGDVRVRSNADWALTMDSMATSGFRVYVRPSGDRFARWIPANGMTSISGPQGVSNLSWDVKIEAPRHIAVQAAQETVQFALTIGQM